MASITIRNLDDALKATLRVRAARHGRSMEDEVRHILREALTPEPVSERNLVERIRTRFAAHPKAGPPTHAPPAADVHGRAVHAACGR
jgi:hypothetical protein